MTTPSNVTHKSAAASGTLLDVDLPFLKLYTSDTLSAGGHSVEFYLDGRPYQVWCVPSRTEEQNIVWVRLQESPQLATAIERLFLHQRMQRRLSERRNVDRHRTQLQVVSPDLPTQRATTYDVSETGLRLVTEKPVPTGQKLRLVVSDGKAPVSVQGECVWTSQRLNSLFHVGVRLRP